MQLELAIRALMGQARGGPEHAVTPTDLAALAAGDLSPDAASEIRERLCADPESVRALLDLKRFPEIEPKDERSRLTDEQVAEEWCFMNARLRFERAKRTAPDPVPHITGVGRAFPRVGALAAVLALLCLGLSLEVVSLYRQLVDSRTRINTVITTLMPSSQQKRAADSPEIVEIFPETQHLEFILSLSRAPSFETFAIEVFDSRNEQRWSREGLRRQPIGHLTFGFARDFLPPGNYRLHLSGLEGDRRKLVEIYCFKIEEESP